MSWSIGGVALVFGLLTILWFEHNFLWEWDFWAGTFGLAVMAIVEVVLFMWVFGPENAWRSLHRGADIRIPRVFRFVMTYVTPLYLLVVLLARGWQDALPIRRRSRAPLITRGAPRFLVDARGAFAARVTQRTRSPRPTSRPM